MRTARARKERSTYVRTYVRTVVCKYVRMYVSTYARTYVRTCVRACARTRAYTHARTMRRDEPKIARACIHAKLPAYVRSTNVRTCAFVGTRAHALYATHLGVIRIPALGPEIFWAAPAIRQLSPCEAAGPTRTYTFARHVAISFSFGLLGLGGEVRVFLRRHWADGACACAFSCSFTTRLTSQFARRPVQI